MASKKLTWLLILQAWTMLWVVIGHSPLKEEAASTDFDCFIHSIAGALFYFAYSFHMPLFIMISGYLFFKTRISRDWKLKDIIKDKWFRLGVPYFFFITVAIIVKICLPGGVNREVDFSVSGLISNYTHPFLGALQEMWFVAVIFLYFILAPIYKFILRTKTSSLIIALIAILMYYIPVSLVTDFLAINRAIHFYIYFIIGLLIARWHLEKYIASSLSIIISLITFIISWFITLEPLSAIAASLAFWGIAIKIDKSLSSNLFHSFRLYTYQIFLIGIFVQILVKILSTRMIFPGSYFIWWLICILSGIYIPVLISKFVSKTNNEHLKRLLGLS